MKRIITLFLFLASVAGLGAWYFHGSDAGSASFRTAAIERGDIVSTISATGTIEPEEVIDVGAQVAGQILSFGRDPRNSSQPINYGSPVEEGTVLANIDESLYRTQVNRALAMVKLNEAAVLSAKAGVEQAKANVGKAKADIQQMEAKLDQADREMQRARRLRPTGAMTTTDYDIAEAAYRTSKATLSVSQATLDQVKAAQKDADANVVKAEAALADAKANLANAEINLKYCTIKSPVKGVIIDRRVNTGQTVVSSLNAPSLFLIAKDLKRLQVWSSVNEADIGNIHSGQQVTFTVDAHPGRVFTGIVAPDQPRLNASMTQNVVTYTVVINTDNSDGKLLPYLTANLRYEVARRTDVLLVPNAALRWMPSPQQVVEEQRAAYAKQLKRKGPSTNATNEGTLWIEEDGLVRAVKVKTGLTDGVNTEVISDELEEEMPVVMGVNKAGNEGGTKNPFAPKMFGK